MELLKKLVLATASIVLVFGAAELWLRSRTSVELGFEYTDGRFSRPLEFDRYDAANRFGFHDAEPRIKEPDRFRLMLLGDSYVASKSVPVPETVGQRLEHHLNEMGEGAFEVVALGKPNWGQVQQLKALHQRGSQLEPDLVVTLFLTLNDVRNNDPVLNPRGRDELRNLQNFRPGWSKLKRDDAPLFWVESSVLNRLISHRLAQLRSRSSEAGVPLDYQVYETTATPEWEAAWRRTEGLLLETRDLARSLGAGYALISASTPHGALGADEGLARLVLNYPAMRERAWDLDGPDRRLADFAARNEIPFLALEPIFRRANRDDGRQLHWRFNGHWNTAGNDEAGRSIARFVHEALANGT